MSSATAVSPTNGGVDLNALLKSIQQNPPQPPATPGSVSVGGSAGANVDAISSIIGGMNSAIKAQQVVQASTLATQKAITDNSSLIANHMAGIATAAGQAQGSVTTAQGNDALLANSRNQAMFDRASLDMLNPNSVASNDITAFNAAHADAQTQMAAARKAASIGIVSTLTGQNSVSDLLDAKLIHTPEYYMGLAGIASSQAKDSAEQLGGLESLYTGMTAVNNSLHSNLTAGVVADQATVAASQFAMSADDAKLKALTLQSQQLNNVLSVSESNANVAVSSAEARVRAENAQREWSMMQAKTLAPEAMAPYVQIGVKMLGLPGAEQYTPAYIKSMELNPLMKAKLLMLADKGMNIAGTATTGNTQLGNLFGTPGETVATLDAFPGSKLPSGSESFQKLLYTVAQGTKTDPLTGKLNPPQKQVDMVNNNMTNWFAMHKNDLDSTDAYGHAPLKAISASAMLNNPDNAAFNAAVVKPLAAGNDSIPLNVLFNAAVNSGLTQSQITSGLAAYGKVAAGTIDAVRKFQMAGAPLVSDMGYTGSITTGSIFKSSQSLNLANKAAINDAVFKARMKAGKVPLANPSVAPPSELFGF